MKTIIISFDMETDIGSWTHEERGIKEGTPEILSILKNHGVQATFLFTGCQAENNPVAVEHALSNGHEVGCHTMYHETMGVPVYDVPVGSFILEGEIKGRLELATDVIEKVAGVRPVSFRAPRLFGSTAMIIALEELGYQVDSSFPSYFYCRDFRPYMPSSKDWSKEGRMRVLELPVFFDMDAEEGGAGKRGRDQWPMLRLNGAERFSELCYRMMERVKDHAGNSILCVYLHPWEFVEMPESVVTDECRISFNSFLYENTGRFALNALDAFIGAVKQAGVEFTTMKEFANSYDPYSSEGQS